MADTQTDSDKTDGKITLPSVREAIDATDHEDLTSDPSHGDGKTDIAVDESFPASDPPAHSAGGSDEPAPSSGYDEAAEQKIQARRDRVARRAHAFWEAEGRPEGRSQDHWLRAETEEGEDEAS